MGNIKKITDSYGDEPPEVAAARERLNKAAQQPFGGMLADLQIFKDIARQNSALDAFRRETAKPTVPKFSLPTESERNEYQSAGRLINRLSERYDVWQANYKDSDVQIVIYAFADGLILRVNSLTEESFHGIAVEGMMLSTDADCLLVCHQAGLKLLCIAEKITPEQPKRQIGFYTAKSNEADA